MNEDCEQPVEKKRRIVYDTENLHCAITSKSNDFLETLKHNEVYLTIDLTCTDENGNTALHLIFKQFEEKDVVQMLEIFFEQGVDLNVENGNKETALHLAVAKRMRNAIDLLLEHNADINKRDDAGNLISHFFIEDEYDKFLAISELGEIKFGLNRKDLAESESANFAEWLTSKGLDFGAPNSYGWSALHMAVERNLQHILPALLRSTSAVGHSDERGRNLLHLFLRANDKYRRGGGSRAPPLGIWSAGFTRRYALEIVRALLDGGASPDSPDESGDTPLHLAVRNNEDMDLVEMLLEDFANLGRRNAHGDTVFHEAIRGASSKFSSKANYYLEVSRALLAKGSDVNSRDRYQVPPIYYAVSEKKLPAIQLMKEYRADFGYVTKSDQNLLHLLAFKCDNDKRSARSWEAMFELLIGEGCLDVNKADKYGQSPLHLAIKHNNAPVIRKLIASGADVNRRNADSARPLDRVGAAVTKIGDCHATLRMLLGHGAHVNARDIHGGTALSHALSIRSSANVAELLKHGADINEPFLLDLIVLHHDMDDNPAVEPILQHYVRLKAAGMRHSKEYDALVSVEAAAYRPLYRDCLRELEILKSTLIDDRVSLYRWLRMNLNQRCSHLACETLKSIVDSPELAHRFPKYFVLLLGCYREANTRKSILAPAGQVLRRITNVRLPDVCLERILAHLDNADLLSIIEDDLEAR